MGIEATIDSPLAEAVRRIGTQSAFGRLIKKSQTSVYEALRDGKPLWAESVLTVEAATGIPKEVLRPDIYPPEDGSPPPFPAEPHRTDDPAPGSAATLSGTNEVTQSGKPLQSADDGYDGAHA
jgi:DNA-binding transcriptional regulator YdaS (Cro superfamily)